MDGKVRGDGRRGRMPVRTAGRRRLNERMHEKMIYNKTVLSPRIYSFHFDAMTFALANENMRNVEISRTRMYNIKIYFNFTRRLLTKELNGGNVVSPILT